MVAQLSREVAAALESEIRGLPSGHRLDGEHEIMRRFEVSRSTVRAALRELEERYLVRRVQGSGTFVSRRIDYVISRTRRPSLHDTIAAAGARPHTRVLEAAMVSTPPQVSERLQLGEGAPAQRFARLSYIDDVVSGYSEEWVNAAGSDHLDVGLRVIESLDQVLRGQNFDPVRAWCRIAMEHPPPHIAEHLELVRPVQTWVVESMTRDRTTQQALMCSTAWTRPDCVRVVLELDEI